MRFRAEHGAFKSVCDNLSTKALSPFVAPVFVQFGNVGKRGIPPVAEKRSRGEPSDRSVVVVYEYCRTASLLERGTADVLYDERKRRAHQGVQRFLRTGDRCDYAVKALVLGRLHQIGRELLVALNQAELPARMPCQISEDSGQRIASARASNPHGHEHSEDSFVSSFHGAYYIIKMTRQLFVEMT